MWGDMQCAYHIFAPGTDFTELLKGLPHDLCGVEHWAYVLKGTLKVIYLDGTVDVCTAGDVCYWPAPHNFISDEGAEILHSAPPAGWLRRPRSSRNCKAIGLVSGRGITFAVSRASGAFRSWLERYELTELIDPSHFYSTNRHAAAAFREK